MQNTPLPDFSRTELLVIGDIMLDRYWKGGTGRISPEAPVPVVKIEQLEDRLGGAANVAKNLSVLGCQTALCGVIGNDDSGSAIASLLVQDGISDLLHRDTRVKTITKLRVISRQQQLIRLDFEDIAAHRSNDLQALYQKPIAQCDAVVISDYNKGTLSHVEHIIAAANKSAKPVLVDPKGADFSRYAGATLLTPNLAEFEAVVGSCADDAAIESRAIDLLNAINIDALLITRSEKGMSLYQRDGSMTHIPTKAKEVYDVTGAGDTVIATIAAALAAGSSLVDAVLLANLAAGVVVGKLGTASVAPAELQMALNQQHNLVAGIYSQVELQKLIAEQRAAGETIVMTNGCFDILHPGHIAYLQHAASLGDRLIVAVNSDDSVKGLKGEGRPINGLVDRMTMLAALACVDWVVSFDEETPKNLIEAALPDVLIKGGDYRAEDVAGYEAVTQAGGEVVIAGFVDGYSTSFTIQKIKDK